MLIKLSFVHQYLKQDLNNLPPLLREIEIGEQKQMEEKDEPANEEVTPEPVEEVKPEKQGRELPAFMRKLFKK